MLDIYRLEAMASGCINTLRCSAQEENSRCYILGRLVILVGVIADETPSPVAVALETMTHDIIRKLRYATLSRNDAHYELGMLDMLIKLLISLGDKVQPPEADDGS